MHCVWTCWHLMLVRRTLHGLEKHSALRSPGSSSSEGESMKVEDSYRLTIAILQSSSSVQLYLKHCTPRQFGVFASGILRLLHGNLCDTFHPSRLFSISGVAFHAAKMDWSASTTNINDVFSTNFANHLAFALRIHDAPYSSIDSSTRNPSMLLTPLLPYNDALTKHVLDFWI